MIRARLGAALLATAVGLGGPAPAAGQGVFGKNPMRTNPELGELRKVASGRVDVLYYAPLDTLARLALPIADHCIDEMEERYDHRLAPHQRVTIFLFGEYEDYRQGWILPGYPTPPSSGYTEPLKGNIGVSFDADAGRLYEVVCHEVAHRFQYSIQEEAYGGHPMDEVRPARKRYFLPPWVSEGDATYVSGGGGSLGDMIVRYVVNSGRVAWGLEEMLAAPRSPLSYYLGAEFWRFAGAGVEDTLLAELRRREHGIFSRLRLGDSLRVRFLKEQSRYPRPKEALEDIYGVPLRELDAAFRLYLKRRFGRDYGSTLDPPMFADRLGENPDAWFEQPYVAEPRLLYVDGMPVDSVVDLYYTANPDGYESIWVVTLPYGEAAEAAAGPEEPPDPALFDACLREGPEDCAEFGAEARPADGTEPPSPRLADVLPAGPRRVVRAGTEACQSLDPRSNRLDVHAEGDRRLLVYVCTDSRRQTKVLGVWDLDAGSELERHPLRGLGEVGSPSWSPDGRRIAFSAIGPGGTSDLYLLDRSDGTVRKLTDDVYADGSLDWSPDGRTLVFASDRGPFGDPERRRTHSNLYLLDLSSGTIEYLTYGPWRDVAPTWSPDGTRVLFASDRSGVFDLYEVDRGGRGRRLTRVSTGITAGQWWPDGEAVVFTAFDGSQHIYSMELTADGPPPVAAGPDPVGVDSVFVRGGLDRTWQPSWSWDPYLESLPARMARAEAVPDRYHLTLGGLGGSASTFGTGNAGISLFFSTLDNSRLIFSTLNSGLFAGDTRVRLEVGKYQNFQADIGYMDLSRRLFWGARCYRHSGLFVDEVFQNIYGEDRIGCSTFGQYPLSTYRRLEFSLGAEYSDQADQPDLVFFGFDRLRSQPDEITFTRRAWLLRLGGAYVWDNTLWVGRAAPVDGERARVDCGIDMDIKNLRPDTWTCFADLRKYWRAGPRSAFGTRAFGFFSDGFTSRRFTLDWRNHMSLYPAYGLYGQYGWVANAFLGFPLVDRLSIRTPVLPIHLPPIRGTFFADAGQAWLEGQSVGPVWGDLGVRASMAVGPIHLALNWGYRFSLWGGDISLPDSFRGTAWKVTLRGDP